MSDVYLKLTIVANPQSDDAETLEVTGLVAGEITEELLPVGSGGGGGGGGGETPSSFTINKKIPINVIIQLPKGISRLLEYLPWYYQGSKITNKFLLLQERRLDDLKDKAEDVQSQLFIDTATWSLDWYEDIFGVPKIISLTDTARRERIKSKIKGYGLATKGNLTNTIKALTGQNVKILEDYKHQRILIYNLEGIEVIRAVRNEIRGLIPSHIEIIYLFMTWNYLESLNLTWDMLDSLYLTWDELEGLNE